jgi:hypothetical protein
MESITVPTLTVSDAAEAAGVPADLLRHLVAWVPQIGQPERRRGQWRRLAVVDTVRVAVAGLAYEFGFTAAECAEIVHRSVDRHVGGLALSTMDLPPSFIRGQFAGVVVYITRTPEGVDVAYPAKRRPDAPATLTLNLEAMPKPSSNGWRPSPRPRVMEGWMRHPNRLRRCAGVPWNPPAQPSALKT